MPRALDSQQLTITHSPTQRIDFNNAKQGFPAFDPVALVTQWTQFLEDYGFQIISDITGIDLTTLQSILGPLVDGLDLVTDALSALTSGDPTQLLAFFTELGSLDILNVFPSLLGAFDGIDFTNPGAILAAIAAALEDVPILGDIVAAITGSSGDLTDLTSWFTDLLGIFGDPAGLGTGSPTLGDLASIPLLGPIIAGLVNGGQSVNVLNLFGSLPENLFGNVFASSLTTGSPNLLNNGGFDGSISMDGDGIWLWDAAVGHTTTGSASTVANSSLKALLSNAVSVAEGQKLTPTAWTKGSSYTGSGTPIRLAVRTYLHGAAVSTTNIQSIAGPGGTWTQLTGSYTVPAGVDSVRLRLVVDTTATSGTIWFDDATLTKPGNGPFDGILALFNLSSLEDLFDGLDVDDIWTTIINTIISPLGLLFGIGDDIPDTNVPGIGSILDEIFGGITGIFNLGRSHTDLTQAVQGQTDALTGNAAMLSQVVAALSPGTPDSDDFERTSTTDLGAGWTQYQTGAGAKLTTTNGHDAQFAVNLLTAGEWVAYRTSVFAEGDNQVAELVFTTIPATFGANGYNDLWLRQTNFASFATRTGLCLRYKGDGALNLYWFNSGTPTTLFSGTAALKATAGATMRFEAGIGLAPRRFKAYMNGTPIMDSTEVGTTSQYGASYRRRGFGGKSEVLFANFMPGNLRQWTASG